jgi:hypothetical protein
VHLELQENLVDPFIILQVVAEVEQVILVLHVVLQEDLVELVVEDVVVFQRQEHQEQLILEVEEVEQDHFLWT